MDVEKYLLDFEKTQIYFKDRIKSNHALSVEVLKMIDFSEGSFFTYLPDSANLSMLHEFTTGILPTLGQERVEIIPGFSDAVQIQTTENILSEYIYEYLQKNKKYMAIFEDAFRKPTSQLICVNDIKVLFSEDEVYYVADQVASLDSIYEVITLCDVLWYFLAVISVNVTIGEKNFEKICKNSSHVITNAYDGEGYIIWEKKV